MIHERIVCIRNAEGLSQEKFAERLGLSRNFIALVEVGKKNPSERTLKDICREFRINYSWLTDGVGEMRSDIDADAMAIIDSVMTGDNAFAKRVLTAFARLDVDEWKVIEKLVYDIKEN